LRVQKTQKEQKRKKRGFGTNFATNVMTDAISTQNKSDVPIFFFPSILKIAIITFSFCLFIRTNPELGLRLFGGLKKKKKKSPFRFCRFSPISILRADHNFFCF
jgi:hypothetical protein